MRQLGHVAVRDSHLGGEGQGGTMGRNKCIFGSAGLLLASGESGDVPCPCVHVCMCVPAASMPISSARTSALSQGPQLHACMRACMWPTAACLSHRRAALHHAAPPFPPLPSLDPTHGSTQALWKTWPQPGSRRSSSPPSNSPRQMVQLPAASASLQASLPTRCSSSKSSLPSWLPSSA